VEGLVSVLMQSRRTCSAAGSLWLPLRPSGMTVGGVAPWRRHTGGHGNESYRANGLLPSKHERHSNAHLQEAQHFTISWRFTAAALAER
jgi:hypothetical protein